MLYSYGSTKIYLESLTRSELGSINYNGEIWWNIDLYFNDGDSIRIYVDKDKEKVEMFHEIFSELLNSDISCFNEKDIFDKIEEKKQIERENYAIKELREIINYRDAVELVAEIKCFYRFCNVKYRITKGDGGNLRLLQKVDSDYEYRLIRNITTCDEFKSALKKAKDWKVSGLSWELLEELILKGRK